MVNPFLTNTALDKFVKGVKVSQDKKNFLLSKIPQLDEEERIKLFKLLKEIYLLDLEEKKATERIKKYWEK